MGTDSKSKILPLPLLEALAELDALIHEQEDRYGDASVAQRKVIARTLVALGMARAALASTAP